MTERVAPGHYFYEGRGGRLLTILMHLFIILEQWWQKRLSKSRKDYARILFIVMKRQTNFNFLTTAFNSCGRFFLLVQSVQCFLDLLNFGLDEAL